MFIALMEEFHLDSLYAYTAFLMCFEERSKCHFT